MDPAVLLVLSNLLLLHNHLHPLLSDAAAAASPSTLAAAAAAAASAAAVGGPSPLQSSSAAASPAPLLFLAVAAALSYAASRGQRRRPDPPRRRRRRRSPSAAFQSLSSGRIWSMDPAARDRQWRSQYGLSYPVFAALVETLSPHLAAIALPLPPALVVSLSLARLSGAASPAALSRSHRLAPALVAKATNAVTRLLATRLYPDYVRVPTGHRLLQTVQSFRDLTALPAACGAVAASPIRLRRAPAASPAAFRTRRGFPAVLLQTVADARKIFWDVCVKAPGAADDAAHFRDSLLYRRLAGGDILGEAVAAVRGVPVRPFVVGDHGFPLLPFLLTPFGDAAPAAAAERAFDAAAAKGRAASVEAALGLLKGRWRILRELDVGADHAAQTVVACCVLHNICQIAGEPEDEEAYAWRDPRENAPPPPPARPVEAERSLVYSAETLRRAIADDLFDRQQRLSSGAAAAAR
ncbi:PIF / Ping-Pong family of plant transposase [Wolffia australiana]